MAVGAAVASSKASAASSNAYSEGYVAGASNTSTVNANAAAANANAAAANANAAAASAGRGYTMGEIVATVPAGCASPSVQGKTYYLCGDTWLSPSYGANGVYYRVVPTP